MNPKDLDDNSLIRAYDNILAEGKAYLKDIKNRSKGNKSLKYSSSNWNVGDYCKALYSDGWYYEAKIVSLNEDFCTVKFLGYEELEDVELVLLEKSEGKKARRRQIKECREETFKGNASDHDSDSAGNATDTSVDNHPHGGCRKKKSHGKYLAPTCEAACHHLHSAAAAPVPCAPPRLTDSDSAGGATDTSVKNHHHGDCKKKKSHGKYSAPTCEAACHHLHSPAPAPVPCCASPIPTDSDSAEDATDTSVDNHHHGGCRKKKSHGKYSVNTCEAACHHLHYAAPAPMPYCAPPIPTANIPFIPPPAAVPQFSAPMPPPLPHFPNLEMNSTFASAMSSWYLAGYYTGINSGQKEKHGCQCSCNHSN